MPAATKSKTQTNLENVLVAVRSAGKEGIAVKDLATSAGLSVDTVRKAVKTLIDEGTVTKTEDNLVVPVMKQGRRSVEVVERDEKILAVIQAHSPDGISKKDVAEQAGTTERLVYESIWRLRAQGKIERSGATRTAVWVAVG